MRNWKNKGWKIAMHGFTHVYDKDTEKKDYFGYGGRSEFYGHSLEVQTEKIRQGLKKFKEENIEIKSFFAPNHTYDLNTFSALKSFGINEIIDGYGLMPYLDKDIKFIPQLFYKTIKLPFGIQSFQIHLNYLDKQEFNNLKSFIEKNYKKFFSFDQALSKVNNNLSYKIIRFATEKILKTKRIISN